MKLSINECKINYSVILPFIVPIMMISACSESRHNLTESTDPYRPFIHFTPDSMWMNDPNGLVYHDGEYHLFYQYYPKDIVWGPMHWGHAVSTDMIHWQDLPIALYPDSLGYIFSGSAVVDYENTSGLGSKSNPAIVAIYTYHDAVVAEAGKVDYQTQGLAYSTDHGRTWTKYDQNPVLENPGIIDFRDPKVFWYDEGKKWIMSLAVRDHIRFYSSPNLIDWHLESDFGQGHGSHGGVWECPDLIPFRDERGKDRWALLVSINPGSPNGGSGTQYFIGDFDGTSFNPDSAFMAQFNEIDTSKAFENNRTKWLDLGTDNYAGVTWGNIPERDGRKLFIGWMSNWLYGQEVPTTTWRSSMTLPRTLSVKYIDDLPVLAQELIVEHEALRMDTIGVKDGNIKLPSESATEVKFDGILDTHAEIELSNGEESLTINLDSLMQITIDRTHLKANKIPQKMLTKHSFNRAIASKQLKGTIVIDNTSIEVFLDKGTTVFTQIYFTERPFSKLSFNGVTFTNSRSLNAWKLERI